MVVSMMAPAASAFAADLVIAGQTEAKADAKAEYSVEVGKEVDFKFYGANAGWQDLYKWESGDEAVAKTLVNEEGVQEGKFLGVKDGKVEITLTIGEQKATVVLVVGKGEVVDDKAFEVKQTTSNTVELVFADAKNATKDITVTKLGKTTSGEVTEIVWPVNKVEVKDNKATVTTWVDFGTGSYRFTANGVSVDKDTAVGYPEFAVITYKDTYTYAENGNKAAAPEIAVYDAKGVKLTGYNNWYFELLNTDANAYVENTTGNLYLWSVGAKANIKATLTYVVGTETKTVDCPVEVECVAKPPYTVNNYIEQYALVAPTTAAKDIAWGKTDVIIGDGNYKVAALIKDSLDKTNSLNGFSVNGDKNPQVVGYYAKYAISNPTVALVDDTNGYVLGVNEGSAYVLVTLYKADANGDSSKDQNLGVIAAIPVTVKGARKATAFTLDKYSDTLLTSGDFTKTTVTATVKDQHGGDANNTIASVYAKVNNVVYSNETGYVTLNGNKFEIDAKDFAGVNLNAITFEVKTVDGLKANYVLSLKKLPEKVNQMYALKVDGATNLVIGDKFDGTANVAVVSAWAGSNLYNTAFYWGKPETCKVGDLFVTVTAPDGKDLTSTTTATTMALAFNAITSSTTTAAALTTMANGNYVVKLQQVTQVATGTDNKQIVNTITCDTKTFEIKNNLPGVTDFKVLSNNCADAKNPIDATTVNFKVDGKEWKDTAVTVLSVNAKDLDGSVYVYDFTVKVPYGTAGAYYTVKVPVGQIFTEK
jgi:hypothetical protein